MSVSNPPRPTRSHGAADPALTAAVMLITAVGYWRTLFPGLGGGGDAAKFQFVGRVLGTPHPPGYPLYVIVSWCFAHIPAGTLAWRINLMSAVFASITCGLAYAIARRVGCHRLIAFSAALALGFDRYLWSKAVHAEVYTLGAALVALTLFCAVRWWSTRRVRDLYLTALVFGISLGNHLTAATVLPGICVFVLMADPRMLRWRIVGMTALLAGLGLLQYGFIWLRTVQHAAYLEARAESFRELIGVVRASRFGYQIFAFSPGQVLRERVPLLWSMLLSEFNVIGMTLLILGAAWLLLRRRELAALFLGGAAGVVFLTLNVDADVDGFIIPATVLFWIVAAQGLEAALTVIQPRRAAMAAVTLVAIALPVLQLHANLRANDHHRRDYETRYMDALFARLEQRAIIVRDAYDINHLLYYKLIGERAALGRDIQVVPADTERLRAAANAGVAVYAFANGRVTLEEHGFRFAPVSLSAADGTPIDTSYMPVFRLTKVASCLDVGDGLWHDATPVTPDGRLVLRIDNYRPFDASVVVVAGFPASVPQPLLAASQAPYSAHLATERYDTSSRALIGEALSDAGADRAALLGEPYLERLVITVNDNGQAAWSALDLREQPDRLLVKARVDRPHPKRASVCGWAGRDLFEAQQEEHVTPTGHDEILYGMGWYAAERSPEGLGFRWMANEAEILLPLARTGDITIRLGALPFSADTAAHQLSVAVNGISFPAQRMGATWASYEWTVPASTWTTGFNRLLIRSSAATSPAALHLSSDTRRLGVALKDVSLTLKGAARQ